MTTKTDISPEAVEAHLQFIAHNKVYQKLEDADREAYAISEALIRAQAARIAELEAALVQIRDWRKSCHEFDKDMGHDLRDFDVDDVVLMELAASKALIEKEG